MSSHATEAIPGRTIRLPRLAVGRVDPRAFADSRFASLVLAAAGICAWALAVGHIHPYSAGAVGLVSLLPALWWVGLLLVAVSFGLELVRPEPRTAVMLVSVVALAVVLHGTLPASEPVPRFDAAYSVAGFSDYLARTGQTLPRVDARMSWFGIFSATGMAARAMEVPTLWFLRWAPLVFELAYLIPLKALANVTLRSSRARWAALGIFLAGNWIDQDYFSPQAIGLLLYLIIAVMAVRTFGGRGLQPQPVRRIMEWRAYRGVTAGLVRVGRLPLDATPSELPPEPTTSGTRVVLLAVILIVSTVLTVSHQFSPVALCLVLFALVLVGRTQLKTLWLFIAFVVFAWLSWEARPYWSGHLSKIFGSVGNVGTTVSGSVAGHTVSTSIDRTVVEAGRVAAAAVVWLGAAVGAWTLWRRGRTLWTVVVLAVAPVAIGGAVSYGGEVALRILLFSLAPLALLVAALLDGPPLRRISVMSFAVVACLLLVVFPLDRFGNESFEAFSPGDLASAEWIHAHAPLGSAIYLFNRDEPLEFNHVGDYKLFQFGTLVEAPYQTIEAFLPRTSAYIYLTRSEYEDGVVYDGLPSNWLSQFKSTLAHISFVRQVYANSTAVVYLVSPRPRPHHTVPTSHPHLPRPTGHTPVPKPPPPVKIRPPVVRRPKPTPITRPKPTPTTRPKRPKPTTTTTTTTTLPPPTGTTVPTTTTTVPTTTTTVPPTPGTLTRTTTGLPGGAP